MTWKQTTSSRSSKTAATRALTTDDQKVRSGVWALSHLNYATRCHKHCLTCTPETRQGWIVRGHVLGLEVPRGQYVMSLALTLAEAQILVLRLGLGGQVLGLGLGLVSSDLDYIFYMSESRWSWSAVGCVWAFRLKCRISCSIQSNWTTFGGRFLTSENNDNCHQQSYIDIRKLRLILQKCAVFYILLGIVYQSDSLRAIDFCTVEQKILNRVYCSDSFNGGRLRRQLIFRTSADQRRKVARKYPRYTNDKPIYCIDFLTPSLADNIVGHGADPGIQAVSLQVTFKPSTRL